MKRKQPIICPIYFEDRHYAGKRYRVRRTNIFNIENIRTAILNGKPYYAAVDLCRAIGLGDNKSGSYVKQALIDIENSITTFIENGYNINYGVSPTELFYYLDIMTTHPGKGNSIIR